MEEEMGLNIRHYQRKYVSPRKLGQGEDGAQGEGGPKEGMGLERGCGSRKRHSSRKKRVLGDGKGDGVSENMFLGEKTCP